MQIGRAEGMGKRESFTLGAQRAGQTGLCPLRAPGLPAGALQGPGRPLPFSEHCNPVFRAALLSFPVLGGKERNPRLHPLRAPVSRHSPGLSARGRGRSRRGAPSPTGTVPSPPGAVPAQIGAKRRRRAGRAP